MDLREEHGMSETCCAQKKGNEGKAGLFPSVSTWLGFERKGNDQQADELFLPHPETRGGTRGESQSFDTRCLVHLYLFLGPVN